MGPRGILPLAPSHDQDGRDTHGLEARATSWSRPISRILSWTTICLRGQPGGSASRVIPSLFGLASGGVCTAGGLPLPPVSSYLTISPLPARRPAVCFCCTFRRVAPPRLERALTGRLAL
ncbi:hypothetical protein OP10G_1899 [Fimbriimonas ginsengisoli Gsoil 348]|uniref:Uncharacterized protein n=1 Tax=Fimbriimonas ginsengisoli Gsoil 348 TaxID=661478 RepID=A0A068NPG5_FIMGI|nr:hypothetical protein OP10G_1899 [Fimbriimonas ginsengisoli Gsoil 348]